MDPIALTRELIGIPSPTGEEGAVVDFMAGVLEREGFRVTRQPVSPGRENLYASTEPPELVFSTHLDVVPPHLNAVEDDEFLHGRGACDAKGLAAAMLAATLTLRSLGEHRIGLLFVVGEENGSDGARAAADLAPRGRFLINGEPTENRLCIGQKGALRVSLTARGRAAHSGYPGEGSSAVDALLDTLERIRGIPIPSDAILGASTLNIGRIAGGVAPNVIPADASAELLFRTVADTGALRQAIVAATDPRVIVEFPLEIPSVRSSPVPGWETTIVSYASDLPFLAPWGERYQLGPGTIRLAHTAEERIGKRELLDGVDRYVSLATTLLAREAP
jgi:acetylornithine deacetylase